MPFETRTGSHDSGVGEQGGSAGEAASPAFAPLRFLRRFALLVSARNKEFYRDREAMAWNFVFPILVVFGFSYMFSGSAKDQFKVSVVGAANGAFLKTDYVQFIRDFTLDESLAKLRRHQIDMVYTQEQYWVNSTSPKGYLVDKLLKASGDASRGGAVEGAEIRYIDWLISGLLAMNMMFSALFGVGYVLVRYRKNGVLKRLKATPLRAVEFLAAQLVSRYFLILFVTVLVYAGCHLMLEFRMEGSYFDLFVVISVGSLCLIALGLLIAARTASEELAGGILNLISWPMIFLSGVWFSLEGANPIVRKIALAFPLTHVIDAARAIMTEGAGLAQVSGSLGALAVMTAFFLGMGAVAFRWES